MAMTGQAQINVTPLIDVLLVLLIIFMVITPTRSVGLDTVVPQQDTESSAAPSSTPVVIMVKGEGRVEVNTAKHQISELPELLTSIFHGHPDSTVFIAADKQLEFNEIATTIDVVKGAGIKRIGLMPGNTYPTNSK